MATDKAAEEEAVFDRQTRLWGADAQQRIRSSRVLVRGKFQGLSSELCKNLVLAGVNVSILDDELVEQDDVLSNIFLRMEDLGKPRAAAALERLQEMNPFADVKLVTSPDLESGKDSLSNYKMVVSIGESFRTIEQLGEQCRTLKVPFIAARGAGTLAFAVLDLGEEYKYAVEGKEGEFKTLSFPPLKQALNFTQWDSLPKGRRGFPFTFFSVWICRELELQQVSNGSPAKRAKSASLKETVEESIKHHKGAEVITNVEDVVRGVEIFQRASSFPPVCTINGGLIGQEVLKVVSGKGEPIKNFMCFDAMDASASVRCVPSM